MTETRINDIGIEETQNERRRRRRRRRADFVNQLNTQHRRREGFSDLEFMKLIETCGKTLSKEDLTDPQSERYNCESNCSICLGEWEER